MRFLEKILHFFTPRESNNHKAKILHPSSMIVIAAVVIVLQGAIDFFPRLKPNILGYASSISPAEVVNLTNARRADAGLGPLIINQTLSSAAYTKGRDMIDRDYWAHVAPDGTQPWTFFSNQGYKYRYAGENLARDFSSAPAAVDAWMNSPTHRENILNPKYKEIGIGIVEGDLAGVDTTIIVQFFGTTYADTVSQPLALTTEVKAEVKPSTSQKPESTPKPVASIEPTIAPLTIATPVADSGLQISTQGAEQKLLISPFNTTRAVSLGVVILLLAVFILDSFLVSKRKITRVAGRTFAHVIFLMMILAIILILKAGKIL